MKHEEIMKLEAGRELDALIAYKVMEPKPTPITANDLRAQERVTEWYSTHYVWSPGAWWKAEVGTDHYLVNGNYISERGNMFVEWIPAKEPSTDIADAWEVVEKLQTDEPHILVDIAQRSDDGTYESLKWSAYLRKIDGENHNYFCMADNAPLAICRAALMAVTK